MRRASTLARRPDRQQWSVLPLSCRPRYAGAVMRARWVGLLAGALIACGGSKPPPEPPNYADALAAAEADAAKLEEEAARAEEEAARAEEAAAKAAAEANAEPPPAAAARPTTPQPRSTKSYEQAMSVPESLALHDNGAQLTDDQLTKPMKGVLDGCRVPSTAKVTIRAA